MKREITSSIWYPPTPTLRDHLNILLDVCIEIPQRFRDDSGFIIRYHRSLEIFIEDNAQRQMLLDQYRMPFLASVSLVSECVSAVPYPEISSTDTTAIVPRSSSSLCSSKNPLLSRTTRFGPCFYTVRNVEPEMYLIKEITRLIYKRVKKYQEIEEQDIESIFDILLSNKLVTKEMICNVFSYKEIATIASLLSFYANNFGEDYEIILPHLLNQTPTQLGYLLNSCYCLEDNPVFLITSTILKDLFLGRLDQLSDEVRAIVNDGCNDGPREDTPQIEEPVFKRPRP